MKIHTYSRIGLTLVGLVVSSGLVAAQSFVVNTTDIPSGSPDNASTSENVDFGDVDVDGDWDAVFADGGDIGNDQNRIWINQGGLQGGTLGVFGDETISRFPAVVNETRDLEFADYDSDGDQDLKLSNTSGITNQSGRFWTNLGGQQGGTIGVFVDETASRWIGLGGPGSSVPPTAILGSGGFVDWNSDSDFGDIDNDGDLDLVHASYGTNLAGNIPTRIFLNDGNGVFSEFNPSGFQVSGFAIQNGDPALWCDGVHQNGTTDTSGAFCDISMSATDVDFGDVDGDFDLDILHGARSEMPRLFANRLDGSSLAPAAGGALAFRDVSHLAFPADWATSIGNYEQELGDFEGDGDLDIYGINWGLDALLFVDCTLRNQGDGTYAAPVTLTNSGADESEADFLDYDNDGDLDAFVANFSGQDQLYRNNWNGTPGGGGAFSFDNVTPQELPALGSAGLDGEVCDVDGDGDYDVFVANEFNQANQFVENVTGTPDTHAPYIPNVEQAPDRVSGVEPTVVRAHVYDNAPDYITRHNDTWVEVTVGPGPVLVFPATASGGQVFRAEIPGDLDGEICYRFVSEDEYGNQGASTILCYDVDPACPDPVGTYCVSSPNSAGSGGTVTANKTVVSLEANDLVLWCEGLPAVQPSLAIAGPDQASLTFFDGVLCIDLQGLQRFETPQTSGEDGDVHEEVNLLTSAQGGLNVTVGRAYYFQYWYRDPAAGGTGANFTDAVGVCIVR